MQTPKTHYYYPGNIGHGKRTTCGITHSAERERPGRPYEQPTCRRCRHIEHAWEIREMLRDLGPAK
ncbi:MAG: hypothetical protein IVW53_14640 [Chloroflexi bacterium]|nr:hypothetical protein [Chloroflexota bacterium]